ncbi:hypothetical protein G3I29_18820, partial [Streptomyces halstedii]|nr:hypothetical protein [Streptomyces halstedii]
MDYCHPCRRHLNGALVCAGCGTPAEAPAPFAASVHPDHHDPGPPPDDHVLLAEPARRRARGRRGHRKRGRGALLAVGGVVLAAGALSLAELATETEHRDSASEYVTNAS